MYKLLFDSDALIKASKAGFLNIVAENFNVFITKEVYEETVNEGKKGFYHDADITEKLVQNGKIKVVKERKYVKSKKPNKRFGRGEISILQAYNKNTLLVTDDLSFTLHIQKENIKSISSAHLISVLVKKGRLKKDKAHHCLEKLKPYIRRDIYELVRSDIKGE